MPAQLEHVNYTVKDPHKTAACLCDLFDWHIRWEGGAKDDGYSVHVGSDDQYIALYTPSESTRSGINTYVTTGGMNHIAVTVDDIDAMESRVKTAGFTPHNHGDYEPGRRFYFRDGDNIEFEVVSYKV